MYEKVGGGYANVGERPPISLDDVSSYAVRFPVGGVLIVDTYHHVVAVSDEFRSSPSAIPSERVWCTGNYYLLAIFAHLVLSNLDTLFCERIVGVQPGSYGIGVRSCSWLEEHEALMISIYRRCVGGPVLDVY